MSKTLRTWLQLFRAPNLFTVPGDPFAGYVLAAYGAFEPGVWVAVAASVCFYAAGLLDNDLADLREDRAERPQRPLPSGAASPRMVAVVAMLLTALGLVLAGSLGTTALVVAGALVGAIGLYNHVTKHVVGLGALNMGLCRGLSVLLGAAAAPHSDLLWPLLMAGRLNPLLVAVGLVTLYIAAVTNLAQFETKDDAPAVAKWLPTAALLAGTAIFLVLIHTPTFWNAVALFAIAAVNSFDAALRLEHDPHMPLPPVIGQLIRLLLLMQAAICATMGIARGVSGATGDFDSWANALDLLNDGLQPALAAMVLLIAWPISRAVSKRFYAS